MAYTHTPTHIHHHTHTLLKCTLQCRLLTHSNIEKLTEILNMCHNYSMSRVYMSNSAKVKSNESELFNISLSKQNGVYVCLL